MSPGCMHSEAQGHSGRPPRGGVARPSRLLAAGLAMLWACCWASAYPLIGPSIKALALRRLGSTGDYVFTSLGPECLIFGFGLIALPALYVSVLYRLRAGLQALLLPGSLIAFVALCYADVLVIARAAEHWCTREAGIFIYQTVEARGFLGVSDVAYWTSRGFGWIERVDAGGGTWRLWRESGQSYARRVAKPESEFEWVQAPGVPVAHGALERREQRVIRRRTGEVLGRRVYFRLARGWADRAIDFGLRIQRPTCWDGPPPGRGGNSARGPSDLVLAVITPRG
jgi:hypothetical protein